MVLFKTTTRIAFNQCGWWKICWKQQLEWKSENGLAELDCRPLHYRKAGQGVLPEVQHERLWDVIVLHWGFGCGSWRTNEHNSTFRGTCTCRTRVSGSRLIGRGGSMRRRRRWVVCFISAPMVLNEGGLSEGQWPLLTMESPVINVRSQSRTLQ